MTCKIVVRLMMMVSFFNVLSCACVDVACAAEAIFKARSEKTGRLEITDGTRQNKHVLYSFCFSNLGVGSQIVDARFQAEFTNDLGYTIGIGYVLIRASHETSVEGEILNPAVMTNVTPDIHHLVIQGNAIEVAVKKNACYNLVGWAVSSMARAGDSIKLEPGYGKIDFSLRSK